ncbi:hypothetical protein NEFER03_1034 [Nematocida sp. LUAm3]|nr:hypothetical protein NEFER03_1034 [Nematocida sp. LUAm3]KAI5175362.1 hypothetical protein NEFER02_1291 [Nematocida sp. LUAm2]KAI5177681.1 hypothetical protein NEFER01_0905 [Nematocida sp. LUAm1]
MEKKYSGILFTKEPIFVPKTEEEVEVHSMLNRKNHSNDLEDDFFELANGLRDGSEEESEIEEVDEDIEEEEENMYVQVENKLFQEEKKESTPSSFDTFSSLINEVNTSSAPYFDALSSIGKKPKSSRRKKVKCEPNYDECNMILNRLGSLYYKNEECAREENASVSKEKKAKEQCGNWDDFSEEQHEEKKKNKPYTI